MLTAQDAKGFSQIDERWQASNKKREAANNIFMLDAH